MYSSSLIRAAAVAGLAATAAGPAFAADFLLVEGGLWRASKLTGIDVLGPDNRKVGVLSDVLLGRDGKAAYAVIGTGGLLGVGRKDVAVPFGTLRFSQEPASRTGAPAVTAEASDTRAPAETSAPGGASPGDTTANTGPAPTAALGAPAVSNGAPGKDPNAGATMTTPPAPHSAAYPDHATVDLTADQLKAAPAFTYAK